MTHASRASSSSRTRTCPIREQSRVEQREVLGDSVLPPIRRVECPTCHKTFAAASVVVIDPLVPERHPDAEWFGVFCDHCNAVTQWAQELGGDGSVHVLYMDETRSRVLIDRFLRKYPQARGVVEE